MLRTTVTDRQPSRRRLWRALAASSLPAMIALWALWRDVYVLEAAGLRRLGGAGATLEWAMLSGATVALVALLWAGSRPLRVLACTFHALLVSIAFGVAGVLGVMHAFGGPDGSLAAPRWALVALGLFASGSVVSLLATAALVVDDVRAGDAEEERRASAAVERAQGRERT
jgi:hypothetical protein